MTTQNNNNEDNKNQHETQPKHFNMNSEQRILIPIVVILITILFLLQLDDRTAPVQISDGMQQQEISKEHRVRIGKNPHNKIIIDGTIVSDRMAIIPSQYPSIGTDTNNNDSTSSSSTSRQRRVQQQQQQQNEPYILRVNAGSIEDLIDDRNETWKADNQYINNGAIYAKCPMNINGTTLDTLYCKERYFNKWVHDQPFRYNFAVPRNGMYTIKLHFAEIHHTDIGKRIFDIWIGGSLTIRNFDILEEAGFATAVILPTNIYVKNKTIMIELVPKIENPKICGIEIIEIIDYIPPPTKAPTIQAFTKRISAGATKNYIDDNTGTLWEADQYYYDNKGAIHTLCPLSIAGTTLDDIYCKERYFNKWQHPGPFRYDIPVETTKMNGPNTASVHYKVKLHFAEISLNAEGERIFDVLIGGSVVLRDFDIYKEVGYRTAYIFEMITRPNTNGVISIEFVPVKENPKISAIEIVELPDYVSPPTMAPTTPIQQAFTTRISAGATQNWIDNTGVKWESDKYFNGNGAVHWQCPLPINDTDRDQLYCKERYFNKWVHNQPFLYDIPVPNNGTFSVKLHFAETVHQTRNARVFDVSIDGNTAIKNLDIFKEAGFQTAYIVPVITTTTTGSIRIEFIPKKENPKICAIEIVELPNYTFPPTLAPVSPASMSFVSRISAGASESWIDDDGNLWESDKYFGGKGEVFWLCPLEINGTELDSLYCKERYFNKWKYTAPFRYEIPVPKIGYYTVKLHFAETVHNSRGARIFDVSVGGKVVLGSLDIFAEVGFMTAYILPIVTQTSNGFITIEFTSKVEHPKICAIEILEMPDYIPPPTAAPTVKPFEILINSGGVSEYIARSDGRTWLPDQYFIGGGVLFKRHYDIQWTLNDEVYHLERNGEFRYEIPLPVGTYEVLLHFTELHWSGVGQRLFDLKIEDDTYIKNIDIIKMTGGIRRALALQHTLPVTDGLLSLEFLYSVPKVDMPKISGVEVRFLDSSSNAVNAFPLFINCGGTDYTDETNGQNWKADRHFVVGFSYLNGDTRMTAQMKNKMYHTSRYREFRYEIPAAPGTYKIVLYFAEPYYTEIGQRVFDVSIEEVPTFQNVDLIKMGDGKIFVPMNLTAQVEVSDGLLSISFSNNAMVCGIEVVLLQESTNTPSLSPSRTPFNSVAQQPVSNPTAVTPQNCTIPKITKGWSKPFSSYPRNVAEPGGDLIGNDLVIFGGFTDGYTIASTETYALNLEVPNATWQRMDDMPFLNGLTHQGIVVVGMKAYLCGGYIGGSLGRHSDKCFVYDHSVPPGTGQQWSFIAPLPKGGRSGGAMIYDSTLRALIYAGGSQRTIAGQPGAIDYKDTWMYTINNPGAGWVPRTNVPFYANHVNAVTVVDGGKKERHFVFGGQVGDFELTGNIATVYEYIAISDQWVKRTAMPFARGHSTSAVRAVGCGFIVAGGRTNKGVSNGLTGEITYYNVDADTWQSIGRLPVDIHTNVCVVSRTGLLRCETGWISSTFSTETQLEL